MTENTEEFLSAIKKYDSIQTLNNAQQFAVTVQTMIDEARTARLIVSREPDIIQDDYDEPSEKIQKIEKYQELASVIQGVSSDADNTDETRKATLVIENASEQEKIVLDVFENGLSENHLSNSYSCTQMEDGTIRVFFKGTEVGSFNLRGGNSWICYPMGNSGKTKRFDGPVEEVADKTSNWLRYIMNYL